jgi:hypothetical protein
MCLLRIMLIEGRIEWGMIFVTGIGCLVTATGNLVYCVE